MKLIISGLATVRIHKPSAESDEDLEVMSDDLEYLDKTSDDQPFMDYYRSDLYSKEFEDEVKKVVHGGYMCFEYDKIKNQLITKTVYRVDRKLKDEELKDLMSYTQGQWSDGIGEGFEQYPIESKNCEYYISAWHRGQNLWFDYEI